MLILLNFIFLPTIDALSLVPFQSSSTSSNPYCLSVSDVGKSYIAANGQVCVCTQHELKFDFNCMPRVYPLIYHSAYLRPSYPVQYQRPMRYRHPRYYDDYEYDYDNDDVRSLLLGYWLF